MHDVAIIGAGPAGVSCALWLKQLRYHPVVLDKNMQCGGLQLRNARRNMWIATSSDAFGKDVCESMHANMIEHKVSMLMGVHALGARVKEDSVEVSVKDKAIVRAKYLVLAGGVEPKSGGIAGRIGRIIGPGKEIASSDFKGAKVAILGGGDSAFENYHFAKARGAKTCTIFARTLRARSDMLQSVDPSDVVVGAVELGDDNVVQGEKFDHVLVLYGYEVAKASLLGLELAMRPDGCVSTDSSCQTSLPGVYAIGEMAGRMHPCCVTAMADGVVAAKAIQSRIEASTVGKYMGMARRAIDLGKKTWV